MPIKREIVEAAILGFEAQITAARGHIAELRQELGGKTEDIETVARIRTVPLVTGDAPAGRTMSPAGRRAIVLAQKKRWAAQKAAQAVPAATPIAQSKPKRKLSAAGAREELRLEDRRAIVAATKKRWALAKQQKTMTAGA